MGKRRERPAIKIVSHHMILDGKLVAIDPIAAGIPDRCKQVIAEIYTGRKYELIEAKVSS